MFVMDELEIIQFLKDFSNKGIKYRNEIRKEFQKKIERDYRGEKIIIDKRILDALLFEKMYSQNDNVIAKIPVWSGQFLQKVDLSNIDFSDVSFCMLDDYRNYYYDFKTRDGYSIQNIFDVISSFQNLSFPKVDYSMTNAHIDLTKSFEAKNLNKIVLMNCDFQGLDFSNQDFSSIKEFYIWISDVSYTNITIPETALLKGAVSNLSGLDLSRRKIDGVSYLDNGQKYDKENNFKYTLKEALKESELNLSHCILNNTKISIDFDNKKYQQLIDRSCSNQNSNDEIYYSKNLDNALNNHWNGCYLNGNLNNINEYVSIEKNIK